MKVNIRFRDGIASGVCGGCENFSLMVDQRGREMAICAYHYPTIRITRPLKFCTDFQAKGTQDRHEMEKTAWILEVKKGKVIGFRPPKRKGEE